MALASRQFVANTIQEREERMLVLKLERRRPKLTVRVGDQDVELVDLTQD
jgi:hypothetical protein